MAAAKIYAPQRSRRDLFNKTAPEMVGEHRFDLLDLL
jgi:hypothetical protein